MTLGFIVKMKNMPTYLKEVEGLLGHDQVGVGVVAVVVLHNQEVDTHMKVKGLRNGEKIRMTSW